MPEIKVEGLSHVYSPGTPFEKVAIDGIDLETEHGELVGIIGHTGSGKSTFIQHLNALLQPSSGRILYNGEDINATKASRRNIKYKIGLVFQYPEYQLFEETVFADIAFGPKNMKLGEEEIRERVYEAASFVGIDRDYFDKSPLELSGGQKRRVAIAGVIAMRPDVLVLDEPTAGLDPEGCRQILSNICEYRRETGSTVFLVSHSMDTVAEIAERIIVFNNGNISFNAKPEEVFTHAKELEDMGLSVPAPTLIAESLKAKGLPIDGPVYTHEKLLNEILKAKGANKDA
jgi:energy-coupling factor transport system ATP-binding protein